MATHLLVGNPTAQSGRNQQRIDRALALLTSAGITADLLPTLPQGKTIGAVRAALEAAPYQTVIAMGGDGTFREVAAGLYTSARREDVALGMLPTGTANDQGRSFGLHADEDALEQNIDVIRAAHETRLDVGIYRAGDARGACDYFFDSCGWTSSSSFRKLACRSPPSWMARNGPSILELTSRWPRGRSESSCPRPRDRASARQPGLGEGFAGTSVS
jgi:hypothetical protein